MDSQGSRPLVIGGARADVFADKPALVQALAERFELVVREAVETRGRATVALAGGSTPADLYRHLAGPAGRSVPWSCVHFFFGDERGVGPVHPDSNYRMAHECLFGPMSIPETNIHRIEGERPAEEAADDYEEKLRDLFDLEPDQWPRFDLALLGLGADAHTASLFPGTRGIGETHRLVVANPVAKLGADRITLTAPVFNAAAHVWFVVAGSAKAEAVRAVLTGERDPEHFPAQLIAPADGQLRWWLDEAAASRLG